MDNMRRNIQEAGTSKIMKNTLDRNVVTGTHFNTITPKIPFKNEPLPLEEIKTGR